MSEKLRESFSTHWDNLVALLPNLVSALVVLAVFIVIGRLIGGFVRNRLRRRATSTLSGGLTGDVIKYVLWAVGLIAALHVAGFGALVTSMLAGAGISAIIIGFAFKDIAENLLAGLMLAGRKNFKPGDIIEINGYKGLVKDMTLRNVHIRIADGRDVFVPNAMILQDVLTNFTRDGLQRLDFLVGLDTGVDFPAAREVILGVLRPFERILEKPAPNVVVVEIGESTLNVRVLFWIDSYEVNESVGVGIRSRAIDAVRTALMERGYALPARILEHKIYNADEPIPVSIREEGK